MKDKSSLRRLFLTIYMSLFFSLLSVFCFNFNLCCSKVRRNRVDPRASDRQLGEQGGSLGQEMTPAREI